MDDQPSIKLEKFGRWTLLEVRTVLCVMLVGIVDGFDFQLLPLAIGNISQEWSMRPAAFSGAVASGFIGAALGTVVGGWWGDRWGRKPAILLGVCLFGAMTMAIGWCVSIEQMIAARFLSGIGLGAFLPPTVALVADAVSPARRGTAVAVTLMASPVGVTLSGIIGPHLIEEVGWRTTFIICGTCAIAAGGVALRVLKETKPSGIYRGKSAGLSLQFRMPALLTGMSFRISFALMTVAFLVYVVMSAALSWLPTFSLGHGVSPIVAGQAIAFWTFSGMVGNLACAWIVGRYGELSATRIVIFCFFSTLLISGGVLAFFGASAAQFLLVISTANGFFASAAVGALYALSVDNFQAHLRSNGLALITLAGKAGGIVGGGSGFILLTLPSLSAFFVTLGAALLPALLVLVTFRPNNQQAKGR